MKVSAVGALQVIQVFLLVDGTILVESILSSIFFGSEKVISPEWLLCIGSGSVIIRAGSGVRRSFLWTATREMTGLLAIVTFHIEVLGKKKG